MKKMIGIGVCFLLFSWLVSLAWSGGARRAAAGETDEQEADDIGQIEAENAAAGGSAASGEHMGSGDAAAVSGAAPAAGRRILLERDGIRTYMELEEYLPGVIVCQIDPEAEDEALKCQAVIARTYICRLMDGRSEIAEEELDLDYLEAGQNNRKWDKEKTVRNLKRCSAAAEATRGVVMIYEEREILPLFHAVNAGRTRTGDEEYPYLQSVESHWDTESPQYAYTADFSPAELAEKISQIPDGAPVSADALPDQIQTVEKDGAGYVKEIKIGAGTYSGEDIQYALKLPSACFSFAAEDGRIRVSARGVGHGYGMSQAGAQAMAAEGWGYEDILNYYYKNISLISE